MRYAIAVTYIGSCSIILNVLMISALLVTCSTRQEPTRAPVCECTCTCESETLECEQVEPEPEEEEDGLTLQECIVAAVDALLQEEHERRPHERIAAYVGPAIEAAEQYGVDPALVVAVGYSESRLRAVRGDGGDACGAWQFHVRYLDSVVRGDEPEERACARMMEDPLAAALTAAQRLSRYAHVCHYNQGGRCLRADLEGNPDTYSGRVHAVQRKILEACGS